VKELKPANVPDDAIPIPPGGLQPQEPAAEIAGILNVIHYENAVAKSNFDQACAAWLADAAQDQADKIPIRPKPVPLHLRVLNTALDSDTGIIWIWEIDGGPVGVCPDLPPLPGVPSPGHIHVGSALGGSWWQAMADDTLPIGQQTPPNTKADDGTVGTFTRYGFPFGGWYLKSA
jgi:hypothetical protein